MLKWKRPESRENLEKSSERRETGDRTTDYRVHHRHLIFNIASRILLLLFYPFGMWTTRTIYSLQNIYDGVLEKQAPKRWDSVLEKHTRERYNHPVYCLDIPPPPVSMHLESAKAQSWPESSLPKEQELGCMGSSEQSLRNPEKG